MRGSTCLAVECAGPRAWSLVPDRRVNVSPIEPRLWRLGKCFAHPVRSNQALNRYRSRSASMRSCLSFSLSSASIVAWRKDAATARWTSLPSVAAPTEPGEHVPTLRVVSHGMALTRSMAMDRGYKYTAAFAPLFSSLLRSSGDADRPLQRHGRRC